MAYTINDRSKRILDILIKSNVDISKLSILRKTAADWTREEAEAVLRGDKQKEYGLPHKPSSYELGTFFRRPVMGGTPGYELYPDLGLAAAKKLIEMHKQEPNGSTLHTILAENIDEKVPEVAQDIVDLLVEDSNDYRFFNSNFHVKYPEALRDLMYSMLTKKPKSYFYFIDKYRGEVGPIADMVNKIKFPEEERKAIGTVVESMGGEIPAYGTEDYLFLLKYKAWMSNPEAARPIMEEYIRKNLRHSHGMIDTYVSAYPEAAKKALIEWAKLYPEDFITRRADAYDTDALQIALDFFSENKPEKFFHTIKYRGNKIPGIYFSGNINYKENVIKATKKLLESNVVIGHWAYGQEFFLSSDYWKEVFEKTEVSPEIDGKPIEDLAMDIWLKKLNDIKPEEWSGNWPHGAKDEDRVFGRSLTLLFEDKSHGFGIREKFTKYLKHPSVIEFASWYAISNTHRFFTRKLYKEFPEAGRKGLQKYIAWSPIIFFEAGLDKVYPEEIKTALTKYKDLFDPDPKADGIDLDMKRKKALTKYFELKLDDIDTEESKAEEAVRLLRTFPDKFIADGVAAKYPNIFINYFVYFQKRKALAGDIAKVFRTGLVTSLQEASTDQNKEKIDKVIESLAHRTAVNDPLSFFSLQMNGKGFFYYNFFIEHPQAMQDNHGGDGPGREELFAKSNESGDVDSILANVYPEYRQAALLSLLQSGRIDSFYEAIKEFDIHVSTEEERRLLTNFAYKDGVAIVDVDGNINLTEGSRHYDMPSLNGLKLFKYIEESGNSKILTRHSEFFRELAKHIALKDSKAFRKHKLDEKYPDIIFLKIEDLRSIQDKDKALKAIRRARNDLIEKPLPDHIKVNKSIYQADQRPDPWVTSSRYTISQNNTNPTDVLYGINKKLIHAADGVAHSNVGASGFTSAWALTAFHDKPSTKGSEGFKKIEDLKILQAVQNIKELTWQQGRDDPDQNIINSLKEKGVGEYLKPSPEHAAGSDPLTKAERFYEELITKVGDLEGDLDGRSMRVIDRLEREIGIPNDDVGGLIYLITLREGGLEDYFSLEDGLAAPVEGFDKITFNKIIRVLADKFRPIISLPEDAVFVDMDLSDTPESPLVVEQYQSDYPVVYDRIFLGNIRDSDTGEVTEKDYESLNRIIIEHVDINAKLTQALINSEMFEEHVKEEGLTKDIKIAGGLLGAVKDFLSTKAMFLEDIPPNTATIPSKHLPLDVAPEVKDARAHFDTISKAYPYLVLMNAIEVAKTRGDKYIYIIKNAPYYAAIQSKEKADKLYKAIPELVATERSTSKSITISNNITDNAPEESWDDDLDDHWEEGEGHYGYGGEETRVHYEEVYEIPTSDRSLAILRSAAEKITGRDASYDFSLTPAQNRAKRILPKKDTTWNPTPEKIEKLKELTNIIKTELSGVEVPDFYDPISALRYLSREVRMKIVPKKRFKRIFGPIMGELGKLSRASRLESLISEMFIKTSSFKIDRKRALRKFLILNAMNIATN